MTSGLERSLIPTISTLSLASAKRATLRPILPNPLIPILIGCGMPKLYSSGWLSSIDDTPRPFLATFELIQDARTFSARAYQEPNSDRASPRAAHFDNRPARCRI